MSRQEAVDAPFGIAAKPARRRGAIVPSVIYIMWRREMLRFGRDRSQLFGGFSRTILWLVILGYGLGEALREVEGYSYATYVLPGVIVLNVLFASLQSSISLVWDRNLGLLREVLVSPAPTLSVTLGKVFGGATVATIQGTIPLAFLPIVTMGDVNYPDDFFGSIGEWFAEFWESVLDIELIGIFGAWGVMFLLGILMTSFGVFIASRMRTFEGFGAISNGVIQPLYFLSGSIFPLRGAVGGVGFTQISVELRRMLQQEGIRNLGAVWLIQLPLWLQILVYANPVSYFLDLMRRILLRFGQLPYWLDLAVPLGLPIIGVVVAAFAMRRMLRPN